MQRVCVFVCVCGVRVFVCVCGVRVFVCVWCACVRVCVCVYGVRVFVCVLVHVFALWSTHLTFGIKLISLCFKSSQILCHARGEQLYENRHILRK